MGQSTVIYAPTASNTTKDTAKLESTIPPVLQFLFGVTGNIIAFIVLFSSRKKHKWKPFYRLVAGLALTDGGGISLIYPTVLVRYASNFTYDFPKPLCNYSSFMFIFLLTSSAMIVCAMSFDRFMAILYPLRYNTGRKKYRANITLALIWITAAFVSSLPLMGLGSNILYYPGSWCFLNFVGTSTVDRINSFIYSLLGLMILFSTIFFNGSVVFSLCKNQIKNKVSPKTRKRSDIFNAIFLLVLVSVFAACWAPLMVVIFGNATKLIFEDDSVDLLAVRLSITNSIVDPWIYILLRREHLIAITRKFENMFGKISFAASSSHDVIPSTDARQKSLENTMSSGKTLSTDNLTN